MLPGMPGQQFLNVHEQCKAVAYPAVVAQRQSIVASPCQQPRMTVRPGSSHAQYHLAQDGHTAKLV